jgi:hypothetical protein
MSWAKNSRVTIALSYLQTYLFSSQSPTKCGLFELCGIVYDNLVTGVFARKQGDGLYMVGLRHWTLFFPSWKFIIPRLKIEYTLSIMTD